MNVLELFSGIGGMHYALKESGVQGIIKAAIDINTVANEIYKHNFPDSNNLNMNIEGLTVDFIKWLEVDTILMSPPCQPFTRNGLQNDIEDPRSKAFIHILNLLPNLDIEKILIENVKGFETSIMRDILIKVLKENNYNYLECILSPTQIGVPNSRLRYYCLAKKDKFDYSTDELLYEIPNLTIKSKFHISNILENSEDLTCYYLSNKVLQKFIKVLDICYKDSNHTCCFTKAYGRYLQGTGSVYTEKTEEEAKAIFAEINNSEDSYNKELTSSLQLRYFTPKEISRLMCFPESFSFPNNISNRQKYMVLGNSINVSIVAELIKLLQ